MMVIKLRPVREDDGKLLVKWRNSPGVLSRCLNKKPITVESNAQFYREFVETGRYMQFIVERIVDGVLVYPIATVYLKDIDRTNKRCQLCVFTSDDEDWNAESQSLAVRQLLDIAFNELGMHKVYSYVLCTFLDEAELLKDAGFTAEAILKNETVDDAGNCDDVVQFCIVRNGTAG